MPENSYAGGESASAVCGAIDPCASILHAIEHAAHLLPSQGPIAVFVHHNTLHAFENLSFEQAVQEGFNVYGSQPYLSEARYRDEMRSGRIRSGDLEAVLRDDLAESADWPLDAGTLGSTQTRFDLQMAMLSAPVRTGPSAELRWLVSETDALRHFRSEVPPAEAARMVEATMRRVMRDYTNPTVLNDERIGPILSGLLKHFGQSRIEHWTQAEWQAFTLHFLWRLCQKGARLAGKPTAARSHYQRPRDYVLRATGSDPDLLANELLINFSASFLDQGFASWPLPHRDEGFYRSFLRLFGARNLLATGWLQRLGKIASEELAQSKSPLESIADSIAEAGVDLKDQEAFVERSLLALPGWAGMMWQMETNAAWTIRPAPAGTLQEFLAVRLLIDRAAMAEIASLETGLRGSTADYVAELKQRMPESSHDWMVQRAFAMFQVAQLLGWSPATVADFDQDQWQRVAQEIEAFSPLSRRRIFQLAYEYRYSTSALNALSIRAHQGRSKPVQPKFQVMCCIDDREESFRRHLEEIEPQVETFGAAGFFSVAMYFRGAADAHFIPLCPVVIKPRHYVTETTPLTFQDEHRRKAGTRRVLGKASHTVHLGSRGFVGGVATALFGSIASIPMVARVLFPHLTARIRSALGGLVQPPRITQLHLERQSETPGPSDECLGFSVDEMVGTVERLMNDTGLIHFSPLVLIVGHGSSSLNNPHESAYNCGACGGGRGGPNARAMAQMANDARVRARLTQRGMHIPDSTVFVGCYHNTCDDSMTYFDLERLNPVQSTLFARARDVIDEARQRNAHERIRRFQSAPLSLSFREALKHVQARSEDLAQARPEYNHATNAMCVVGRRERTRGLFLDRRSFLTSYDPTIDDDQATILNRILQAVIPVCSGISLEYYFSCVDPVGYGCGSKLPHNITSLLGVMEGATSDLRTGLSAQMTEIHEPLRLLFVVETQPEKLLSIMERNPGIDLLVRNRWVQLATLDPDTPQLHLFRHGKFELYEPTETQIPSVQTSTDWYRGWRDHLGFARVTAESLANALQTNALQTMEAAH